MRFIRLLPLLFLVACQQQQQEELEKQRAEELVRLNYKQQNGVDGAGHWTVYEVVIDSIIPISKDTPTFKVFAHTNGDYKLPEIEDHPGNYTEKFFDTLQFTARKSNKVWLASDWIVLGARHE